MLYHVSRNGQTYGPYTREDLERYVASGNVLLTDLAKSEEMAEWAPVAQVLGVASPGPAATGGGTYQPGTAAYPPGAAVNPQAVPIYQVVAPYPDPPNLHWALVLLIGIFTCGLFFTIWDIVQAAWMRRVNPRSNALFLYIAEFTVSFFVGVARSSLIFTSAMRGVYYHSHWPAGLGIFAVTLTLLELARFDMRRSMEEHYNGPEPIGLSLSGVMTFFFGVFYFQYHFTRINELKRMARYRGAAI
jgi:hypothetical protein